MGAGHSEFDEIEDAIRQVLHDRRVAQELSSEKESRLEQRELEYQGTLRQLSSTLEEKEKKLRQLKEEVEVTRKKSKEASAMRRMELKQNIMTLREQIQLYPSSDSANESPAKFSVGLFGNTGVGKTSLVNSMKFAVKGTLEEFAKQQVAPADFQGGHTTLRLSVGITPFVTFIDNRGIGPEDLRTEGAIEELKRQLGIYPIAAITHVDVATPKEVKDTRHAIESTGITDVYELANITDERPELEVEYQSSLLRLLERCSTHCRRTLEYRNEVEKAN